MTPVAVVVTGLLAVVGSVLSVLTGLVVSVLTGFVASIFPVFVKSAGKVPEVATGDVAKVTPSIVNMAPVEVAEDDANGVSEVEIPCDAVADVDTDEPGTVAVAYTVPEVVSYNVEEILCDAVDEEDATGVPEVGLPSDVVTE